MFPFFSCPGKGMLVFICSSLSSCRANSHSSFLLSPKLGLCNPVFKKEIHFYALICLPVSFCVCVYLSACLCTRECGCPWISAERHLWAAQWVLGNNLRSSAGTVSTPSHQATPPASHPSFLRHFSHAKNNQSSILCSPGSPQIWKAHPCSFVRWRIAHKDIQCPIYIWIISCLDHCRFLPTQKKVSYTNSSFVF